MAFNEFASKSFIELTCDSKTVNLGKRSTNFIYGFDSNSLFVP